MSAAHTPGPWNVDIRNRPKGHPLSIVKFNGPAFTELAYVPHHGAFSDANARLIAAAPKMYAALDAVDSLLTVHVVTDAERAAVLAMVRAALAAAVQP